MKSKWLTLTLLCSLLLNLFFVIGYFLGRSHPDYPLTQQWRKPNFEQIFQELNLSDEQQQLFQTIREGTRTKNKAIREVITQKRQDFLKLLDTQKPDEAQLEKIIIEINQHYLALQKNNLDRMLAFKKILNAEQQKKLIEYFKKMQEKRSRFFPGIFH